MERKRFWRFLRSMLYIGCIGFGGGSALIPVIEREIVQRQGLDQKPNIDKDVIVASITPGALPVEIAASIGRRNFGIKGMVSGAFMMACPGAAWAVLLAAFFSTSRSRILDVVQWISVAVSFVVIYMLVSYVRMTLRAYEKNGSKQKYKPVSVMTLAFALSMFMSTVKVLLLFLTGIFVYCEIRKRCDLGWNTGKSPGRTGMKRKDMYIDAGIWMFIAAVIVVPAMAVDRSVLTFSVHSVLSTWTSFGGGDAYLTIADGFFVQGGFITEQQYYGYIVPVVNVLPGSILCKTLAAVGYYTGWNISGSAGCGILFAMIGFGCSVTASCSSCMLAYRLYDYLITLPAFRMIQQWIRPVIAGLLLKVMLMLVTQDVSVIQSVGWMKVIL